MAVFIVHLTDNADGQLTEQLEEEYPNPRHYKLEDNLYLVSDDDIASSVAKKIGLDGENPDVGGEVLKLNGSFSGFSQRGVWDWLDFAYEES